MHFDAKHGRNNQYPNGTYMHTTSFVTILSCSNKYGYI